MKVRKSFGRRAKLAVRPQKFDTHKNTWDLVKTSEYQSFSNGFDYVEGGGHVRGGGGGDSPPPIKAINSITKRKKRQKKKGEWRREKEWCGKS